jgi:hypothetical protein
MEDRAPQGRFSVEIYFAKSRFGLAFALAFVNVAA